MTILLAPRSSNVIEIPRLPHSLADLEPSWKPLSVALASVVSRLRFKREADAIECGYSQRQGSMGAQP